MCLLLYAFPLYPSTPQTSERDLFHCVINLVILQYFKNELHDNDENEMSFNEIILDLGQIAHTMHFQPDHHSGTRFNLAGQQSRSQPQHVAASLLPQHVPGCHTMSASLLPH